MSFCLSWRGTRPSRKASMSEGVNCGVTPALWPGTCTLLSSLVTDLAGPAGFNGLGPWARIDTGIDESKHTRRHVKGFVISRFPFRGRAMVVRPAYIA